MRIDGAKWREILTLCIFVDYHNLQKTKSTGVKGE